MKIFNSTKSYECYSISVIISMLGILKLLFYLKGLYIVAFFSFICILLPVVSFLVSEILFECCGREVLFSYQQKFVLYLELVFQILQN